MYSNNSDYLLLQLKSMAFGGTSAKPLKPHTNGHAHADASGGGTQGKQWEEWRKLDTEVFI